MNIEQTLRAVYELIEDPKRWCQHAGARDSRDEFALVYDDNACRWCVWGAVQRLSPSSGPVMDFLDTVAHEFGLSHPAWINDNLGHIPTLCLLKTAIATAKERGL